MFKLNLVQENIPTSFPWEPSYFIYLNNQATLPCHFNFHIFSFCVLVLWFSEISSLQPTAINYCPEQSPLSNSISNKMKKRKSQMRKWTTTNPMGPVLSRSASLLHQVNLNYGKVLSPLSLPNENVLIKTRPPYSNTGVWMLITDFAEIHFLILKVISRWKDWAKTFIKVLYGEKTLCHIMMPLSNFCNQEQVVVCIQNVPWLRYKSYNCFNGITCKEGYH